MSKRSFASRADISFSRPGRQIQASGTFFTQRLLTDAVLAGSGWGRAAGRLRAAGQRDAQRARRRSVVSLPHDDRPQRVLHGAAETSSQTEDPAQRSSLPELVSFIGAWRNQSLYRDLVPRVGVGLASARCARLTIAIERHRRARGSWPRALADLDWDGPRDVLVDPFTGRPLQYVHASDGYALYSLGSDARDDGGKIFPARVNGRPPGTGPTPDVGVVLSAKTSSSN